MELNREQLLSGVGRKPRTQYIEGLGGDVYIVPMSWLQRQQYLASIGEHGDTDDALVARIVCECVTDAAGQRLLSDDDVAALIAGDGAVVSDLYRAVMAASGLWSGAVQAAKKN